MVFFSLGLRRDKVSWREYIFFFCGEIYEKMKITEGGFILVYGLRVYSLLCWEDMMVRE